MNIKEKLQLLRDRKSTIEYLVESKKNDFALQLENFLKQMKMTQCDLAESMNRTPAYISKVLRGDANVTIETMVKLSHAAGGVYHGCITRKDSQIQWLGIVKSAKEGASKTTVVKPNITNKKSNTIWGNVHEG